MLLFSTHFRCATLNECVLLVSGLMSTSGRREWSVVSEEDRIHTAARGKTSQEEPTATIGHMRGKSLLKKYRHLVSAVSNKLGYMV